ncbi:MAG TPA: hypothetical protein VFB00_02510 [Terriglobales bacterium]|nr:hypothetical protein [Terriglobales bacterium]
MKSNKVRIDRKVPPGVKKNRVEVALTMAWDGTDLVLTEKICSLIGQALNELLTPAERGEFLAKLAKATGGGKS